MSFSAKQVGLWLAFGLLLCLLFLVINWPDGRLHLVFCDVGQGDGEIIIWKNIQILVDAGPDEAKILQCMAKHIPFWDKKLELSISTHPEEDHLGALHAVAKKYEIKNFLSTAASGSSENYFLLRKILSEEKVTQTQVKQGDQVKIGDLALTFLWPPAGAYFEAESLNKTAIVFQLKYKDFKSLFEADITADEELALDSKRLLNTVEVLKVAHHGSKTSSSRAFVAKLRPKLAIFEVGKNNRFGHPDKAILTQFDLFRSRILRTDQNGTIEVVTDGGSWWVKSER